MKKKWYWLKDGDSFNHGWHAFEIEPFSLTITKDGSSYLKNSNGPFRVIIDINGQELFHSEKTFKSASEAKTAAVTTLIEILNEKITTLKGIEL